MGTCACAFSPAMTAFMGLRMAGAAPRRTKGARAYANVARMRVVR